MKTDYEIQLAKEYYEGGSTPKQTQMTLYRNHAIDVGERTITKWAKKYKWRHWRLAKVELLNNANPALPFGVSKITDPVFHDAEAIAKKYCRGEGYVESGPIQPIIKEALSEVIRQKEGVPVVVLDYLSKVVLRSFIKELRKNKPLDPRIYIDPERQAIIDAVAFIKEDDEVPQLVVVQPEEMEQRVNEILDPESKLDAEVELEVATEMPPDEELQRMVNEEPE